ncbi:MAG: Fic family protein [Dehalococcoidia bacterium]|nr:Fic family protein [Dehalococcoidia bacterium]
MELNRTTIVSPSAPRGRPSRQALYARLEAEVVALHERFGGLPAYLDARAIRRALRAEEAHHSTAIEGNTLVLKQVEALLNEGRAVGNKEIKEYAEVRGYADAAEWAYGQAREGDWAHSATISLTEVRHIHQIAMTPVWQVDPHPDAGPDEGPGDFRRHDIRPFPDGMTPPPWPDVPAQLATWVDEVNALDPRAPTFPEDLARVHAGFERVHPFIDGNGRTGRLALNLVLVRLGYPPVIVYKRQRDQYLRALRRADAGDPGALGEMLARAMLANLHRLVLPSVAEADRTLPFSAFASEDLNENALRAAATRGRLAAVRGPDGRWQTSRAWVEEYRASRYVRGARG